MDINGKTSIGLYPKRENVRVEEKKQSKSFFQEEALKTVYIIYKKKDYHPDTQSSLTVNLIP